jgi:FkbM family methyltransferase
MNYIKKLKNFLAVILCSNAVGRSVEILFKNRIPTIRFGHFSFDLSDKTILPKTKATVFWGMYETSETRMINKFLRNDFDVIELGASLGIISCHIIKKLASSKRLIAVEANPYLINTIHQNINHHSAQKKYDVLNIAVGNGNSDKIDFSVNDDNVYSKISQIKSDKTVEIKAKSLSKIISDCNITDYTLVCDIEGAELSFIIDDTIAFKNCKQIIIELHETEYCGNKYSIEDVRSLIEKLGFMLRANYGAVFVFDKIKTKK